MDPIEVELLEAIRRSPDDDTCRLVYGDWASQHGLPRGELIALQCSPAGTGGPELEQHAKQLIARHRREWLGPLASTTGRVDFVFDRGFLLHPPAVESPVLQAHRDTLFRLSPTVYEAGEVAYQGWTREVLRGRAHGPAGPLEEVAIKKNRHSSDPYQLRRWRERLEQEGTTTGQLAHPNLVEAQSWAYLGGEIALVLEWIDGLDLHALLEICAGSSEPPGEAFAAAVICQVARGLDALHRTCGFVHDAVRPEHVMVGFDGRVKLIDLGSARSFGELRPEEVPSRKERSVRWAYRSPESRNVVPEDVHLLEGDVSQPDAPIEEQRAPVDARSDLFSLGSLLVELCEGSNPVADDLDYRPDRPPRFSLRSAGLQEIATRCLQPRPEWRPSSAGELVASLAQTARTEGWPLDATAIAGVIASRLQGLARR